MHMLNTITCFKEKKLEKWNLHNRSTWFLDLIWSNKTAHEKLNMQNWRIKMGVKMLISSSFDGWNKAEKQGIKTAQTALTHTYIMFPLPFIAMKIVCDGYAIIMHGNFSCLYAKCTVVTIHAYVMQRIESID